MYSGNDYDHLTDEQYEEQRLQQVAKEIKKADTQLAKNIVLKYYGKTALENFIIFLSEWGEK